MKEQKEGGHTQQRTVVGFIDVVSVLYFFKFYLPTSNLLQASYHLCLVRINKQVNAIITYVVSFELVQILDENFLEKVRRHQKINQWSSFVRGTIVKWVDYK